MPDENFSMVFKPDLFYTNSGLTVNNLYIDFQDGFGYRSASFNNPISPSYTSSGDKNIKFKAIMSDNSVYECYSKINIKRIVNMQTNTFTPIPSFDRAFIATANHSGGGIFVRLNVNNNTGVIRKPLIIVEGYDPFSRAPNLTIDGNFSYQDFITTLNNITTLGYNFNQQLDDIAGYDLVFVDYANGTDGIVRNAALLQEIITWVNAQKATVSSTEQNVVMGISMGGLVARYALANMTKNNIATQTRLLITHDSPHKGANVPLGLQDVVRSVANIDFFGVTVRTIFPAYEEAITLLNTDATNQLLKYRLAENQIDILQNTFIDNIYKPMITFPSSGPQPTYRFIATSQGAECGTALFSPGSKLLEINGVAAGSVLAGAFSAKAKLYIEAHSLPPLGQSKQLSKIEFIAKLKFWGLIRLDKSEYNHTLNITSSTLLPIDGATGGTSPIGSLTIPKTGVSGGFPLLYNYYATLNTATLSNFCFVPTASALDVQNFDNASLTSVFSNGWSPSNPSSASTFISQVTPVGGAGVFNEEHIRFTARNANWMFNEMQNVGGNNLNCNTNCQPIVPFQIEEERNFCTSNTINLSVPYINGISYNWSVDPNYLQIISGQNTNSILLQPTANATGIGGVILSLFNNCVNYNLIKNVQITPTIINFRYTGSNPGNPITGEPLSFEVDPVPEAVSYTWYNNNEFLATTTEPYYSTFNWSCGDHRIYVQATTASCGSSDLGGGEYYWGLFTNSYRYAIYPNPADDIITIKPLPIKEDKVKIRKEITANLYNEKGEKLKAGESKNSGETITFETRNIPNGTYYLHITEGKETVKKQIIIKH